MVQHTVVIFTNKGARVFYTNDIVPYLNRKDCVVNPPILPKKSPPHEWLLNKNKIITQTSPIKKTLLQRLFRK